MYYRSVADLNVDVRRWCDRLPPVDLVVGIPRSGLLAANLIALHRNIPMADLDGFLAGRVLTGGARSDIDGAFLAQRRRVLVVDDSVDSGRALSKARACVGATPHTVIFGAVYVSGRRAADFTDVYAEIVPRPRVFEWNVMHHPILSSSCMDIDGVLCRDPAPEENDDGGRYRIFVSSVPCSYKPSVPVGHLVTGRFERYRAQTEAWLAQHGIQYGELHMLPDTTPALRTANRLHSRHKAAVYQQTRSRLFIESSPVEAREIAALTGHAVYCTDTRRMVYPGGDAPAPAQRARWRFDDLSTQLRDKVRGTVGAGR